MQEINISLLRSVDRLHDFTDSLFSLECSNATESSKSFLLSCAEARSSRIVLFVLDVGHIELCQNINAFSIAFSNLLKSSGSSSLFLTEVNKTEVTNCSPLVAHSAFVLDADGQSAVSYLSNQSDCEATLSKCVGSAFAAPDAITVSLSRVSAVDLLVGISACPSSLLIFCGIFADDRNVGRSVVGVCHSSVVVAQHLIVAISTIASVESYLVEAVLQVGECLTDVEDLVLVAELCSVDVFTSGSAAVDVTVPATDVVTLLVLQHLASLLEGAVDDERADFHAWAIASGNGSSLKGFHEVHFDSEDAVTYLMLEEDAHCCTIGIESRIDNVLIQVVLEDSLSLAVSQLVGLEVSLVVFNSLLVLSVRSDT